MRKLSLTLLAAAAAALLASPAVASADPAPADGPGVAQVRAYVAALISHNADAVRFAPDTVRVENGATTATTGAQIADDIRNSPVYKTFQGYRDLTITQNGDKVTGRWLLDAGLGPVKVVTVAVNETFDVPDGVIHHLDAQISPAGS
ncbi:nuclear transport factor 2 family protein [Antrihabitans cavernicola]|uniref:DUF8021 domain-containing protein n=1 Tax=Antrihabitans cavernicola TaxID=2495913 RepID=A0A5A7SB36_9NOCA|nr:nuclear transport factor 2 family protein [Spelaeibacter cavernicola]KAA0021745.1 hypothetical protein FOY51_17840 [Spelaeibacter cavernicola]